MLRQEWGMPTDDSALVGGTLIGVGGGGVGGGEHGRRGWVRGAKESYLSLADHLPAWTPTDTRVCNTVKLKSICE